MHVENFRMTTLLEFIESQIIECRRSIRVPVHIPATILFRPVTRHQSVRAVTRNVSFDGARIDAENTSLEVGAQVRVLLEISGQDPIIIYALVVRNTNHGVALMFTEYDNEALESLSAILADGFNKYLDGRSGARAAANAV